MLFKEHLRFFKYSVQKARMGEKNNHAIFTIMLFLVWMWDHVYSSQFEVKEIINLFAAYLDAESLRNNLLNISSSDWVTP